MNPIDISPPNSPSEALIVDYNGLNTACALLGCPTGANRVDWLLKFAKEMQSILNPDGSVSGGGGAMARAARWHIVEKKQCRDLLEIIGGRLGVAPSNIYADLLSAITALQARARDLPWQQGLTETAAEPEPTSAGTASSRDEAHAETAAVQDAADVNLPVEIDRTGWPVGPWTTEPDRIAWTADTGQRCLMLRHPKTGYWCGYVECPASALPHVNCWLNEAYFTDIEGMSAIGFDAGHIYDGWPGEGGGQLLNYRTVNVVQAQCAKLALAISNASRRLSPPEIRTAMALPGFRFGSGCRIIVGEGLALWWRGNWINAAGREIEEGLLDMDDPSTAGWLWHLVGCPKIEEHPGVGLVVTGRDANGHLHEHRGASTLGEACTRLALDLGCWPGSPKEPSR